MCGYNIGYLLSKSERNDFVSFGLKNLASVIEQFGHSPLKTKIFIIADGQQSLHKAIRSQESTSQFKNLYYRMCYTHMKRNLDDASASKDPEDLLLKDNLIMAMRDINESAYERFKLALNGSDTLFGKYIKDFWDPKKMTWCASEIIKLEKSTARFYDRSSNSVESTNNRLQDNCHASNLSQVISQFQREDLRNLNQIIAQNMQITQKTLKFKISNPELFKKTEEFRKVYKESTAKFNQVKIISSDKNLSSVDFSDGSSLQFSFLNGGFQSQSTCYCIDYHTFFRPCVHIIMAMDILNIPTCDVMNCVYNNYQDINQKSVLPEIALETSMMNLTIDVEPLEYSFTEESHEAAVHGQNLKEKTKRIQKSEKPRKKKINSRVDEERKKTLFSSSSEEHDQIAFKEKKKASYRKTISTSSDDHDQIRFNEKAQKSRFISRDKKLFSSSEEEDDDFERYKEKKSLFSSSDYEGEDCQKRIFNSTQEAEESNSADSSRVSLSPMDLGKRTNVEKNTSQCSDEMVMDYDYRLSLGLDFMISCVVNLCRIEIIYPSVL